jgi:hypothetical protein
MRKPIALGTAPLAPALLSLGQPAFAAGRVDVSGSLSTASTVITAVRRAGGSVLFDQTVAGSIGGSLAGRFTIDETVTIHRGGDFDLHGEMTCYCTASGASGTLVLRLDGTGDPRGRYRGRFTVVAGSGGLANIRGRGTFQGASGVMPTYAGQLIVAPSPSVACDGRS